MNLHLSNPSNLAYLDGKVPQASSPRPMPTWVWLLFWAGAFAFVLAGLAIFEINYSNFRDKSILRGRGVEYEGRMESRSTTTSDDSTTYYITYSHNFREGYYTRTLEVSSDAYHREFERGRQVTLILDPENPALFDLPPSSMLREYSGPVLGLSCAVLWLLGTLWAVWQWIRYDVGKRHLWREGQVVYGKVRSMEEHTDSEGSKQWIVHYEFHSPQSQDLIVSKDTVLYSRYSPSEAAEERSVAVLFLANDNWGLL